MGTPNRNEIYLNVYIEDKTRSSRTPLKCAVHGSMTLNQFKQFASRQTRLPFQYLYLLARGQLRRDNETFSSMGFQVMTKAENVCLFLSKSSEQIEFNHIVEVLSRAHLKNDALTRSVTAWRCPNCTLLNEPTRPGCLGCGTDRPEDYIVPPNFTPTPTEQRRLTAIKDMEEEAERREKIEKDHKKKVAQQRFDAHLKAAEHDPLYFVNQEGFECPICLGDIPAGEGIILRSCAHMLCKGCLVDYIANIDEGQVKCPEADCNEVMEDREIRGVSPPEVYSRYLEVCDRLAQANSENRVHCKTPNCQGWAVTFNKENGEFNCAKCQAKTCIPCDVIHHPMSCKEYQDDLRRKALNDVTKKNDLQKLEEMITNKEAIKCPNCKMIITKNGGCDGFQCLTCRTWLCWATKGPRWGPKGVGDISGGCRCKVNGTLCHPNCKYCH